MEHTRLSKYATKQRPLSHNSRQVGGNLQQPVAQAPAPEAQGGTPEDEIMLALKQVVDTQDQAAALEFCNQLYSAAGGQPAEGGQPATAPAGQPEVTPPAGQTMAQTGGTTYQGPVFDANGNLS